MGPLIAAFAGWLFSLVAEFFTKQVAIEAIKFVAYKALMVIFFIGLAVVLRKFVMDFILDFMTSMAGKVNGMTGGLVAPSLSLSGAVGAGASYLRIADCVSVLCSGYAIAFIRSLLPFG